MDMQAYPCRLTTSWREIAGSRHSCGIGWLTYLLVICVAVASAAPIESKAPPKDSRMLGRLEGCGGTCVVFSRDGRTVATAGEQDARVWDALTFKAVTLPLHHGKGLTSVSLSEDSRILLTCGSGVEQKDGRSSLHGTGARVWDASTGKQLLSILTHGALPVVHAAINRDGSRLATCAENDKSVCVWDTSNGHIISRLACAGTLIAISFRPTGTELLTLDEIGGAQQWDATTGRLAGEQIPVKPRFPLKANYSDDGKVLIVGGYGFFATYDAATGTQKDEEEVDHAFRAAFTVSSSKDGKIVVIADTTWYGNQVWNAEIGMPISKAIITGDDRCFLSPDGKLLVCRGTKAKEGIWEVKTSRRIQTFISEDSPGTVFTDASFSPDGKRIAVTSVVGSDDGCTVVWKVQADVSGR